LTQFLLPMPALRERKMDTPLIALSLLREAAPAMGKTIQGFTPEALDCMCNYQWPGNVREMQNEILRAILLCDAEHIGAHLFSPKVLRAAPEEQVQDMSILAGLDGSLKDRMEALEARVLRESLIRHRWNKTRAATELGLSRVGLRSKLARYGLEKKGE
jgi:two-component system response regulator HupR/HoxA